MSWITVLEYTVYVLLSAACSTWAIREARSSFVNNSERSAWLFVFLSILGVSTCIVNLFFLKLILVTGSL